MTGRDVSDALIAVWATSWVALMPVALAVLAAYARRGGRWSTPTFLRLAVSGVVLAPLAVAGLLALGTYLLISIPTSRGGTTS